ncbi:glycoside hydrolase family 79 protein [Piloderma croceum F 1598]|uniref:Glycoside hydrolase family 79 protein n=1 Tax=Piloderma croceum (strain F 1598) TaxID=765440 RepID=A0A0C3FQS0_PILCF|nr:glycoside hydrolase family 79 protein [Piloderma croceum F 1598]
MHLQLVRSLIPFFFGAVQANVTVYGTGTQNPFSLSGSATATASGAAANYTGAAAYNPTVLNPPPVPDPKPPTSFDIQLQNGGMQGLSITLPDGFFGFSVEMSVANQETIFGLRLCSTLIQVAFLNLMANIVDRSGTVKVRVGGNTQDTAVLVNEIPNGADLTKDYGDTSNPTYTPALNYNADLIYMMANISNFINVKWYLGVPFNNTQHFNLAIAEVGQAVLGDNLIGLQVGNEPDLYARHGHRPANYGPSDYVAEFGRLVDAMANDTNVRNRSMLIGPNLSGLWAPEQIWSTGFATTYDSSLGSLAIEKYPTDNCAAQFGIGTPVIAQDAFPEFLTHTSGQNIVKPYLASTAYAQTLLKPFLMFETNTASCGGFAGISDSFGAALWGADYALQMAYSNFSGALFHVGGQADFYNPFTPPPTNQSHFHQWTIGPIYYSALVVAETIGSSNKSQVVDLVANDGNEFTPAYAVYEDGTPSRVALINFVTDPSGASDYTATISVGDSTPGQVQVKYLLADSVSVKGNFTWANQTFGGNFASDGRLMGQQYIQTIACNGGSCKVKVPAPSFALVFLSDKALSESDNGASQTFSTSLQTKTLNTATINPSVLATSNGHKGFAKVGGSTSREKGLRDNAASGLSQTLPSVVTLVSLVAGGLMVSRVFMK